MLFHDPTQLIMQKSLDGLWERTRAISDNLVNSTTPGYKRKTVAFEDMLAKSLRTAAIGGETRQSLADRIARLEPTMTVDDSTTMNVDGNNVDLDQEYTSLNQTAYQYQYMERLLNDSFSRLRTAIKEGR